MRAIAIGELALRSGTKVPTIRFYESIGLLPSPTRTTGGQRRFDPTTLERLALIRHARESGFDTEEIRGLLDLYEQPNAPCEGAAALADTLVRRIDTRLRRLKRLRNSLANTVASCKGSRSSECTVLRTLADH